MVRNRTTYKACIVHVYQMDVDLNIKSKNVGTSLLYSLGFFL